MNGDSNADDEPTYVPTPRANPRLRPEGESFEARNRAGCGERWYDYTPATVEETDTNHNANTVDRMPSDEAKRNAQVNKGSMKDIFGGYCDPPPKRTIHPRGVTSVAADTAQANKGGNMRHLIDDYGRCTPDLPPVPKLKGDLAPEFAERDKGSINNVINNYGVREPTDSEVVERLNHINRQPKEDHINGILKADPPTPRTESRGYGRLHEVSGESWDELPPQRHCRPEGAEISRHMNNHMGDIMSMKGEQAQVKRPVKETPPQLKETGTPRAHSGKAVTAEAQTNYDRDHSNLTMNAIFGREPTDVTPRTVKVNRMMQRSENW